MICEVLVKPDQVSRTLLSTFLSLVAETADVLLMYGSILRFDKVIFLGLPRDGIAPEAVREDGRFECKV